MEAIREDKLYTYSDYYSWDDDKRWELIDGIAYAMAPAPSLTHQSLLGEFFYQLYTFLKGKTTCRVFIAPFDVRLNPDGLDDTVVQPDITVVCDESKLDDRGCRGVPEMAIEVLSPSSTKHDRVRKFELYQRYGVIEYWIVDPVDKSVQVNILENGQYGTKVYAKTEVVAVHTLEGCTIRLSDFFE